MTTPDAPADRERGNRLVEMQVAPLERGDLEARKFGVGLVLANQHLTQLDAALRGALLGNVGTLIAFRLSADDAIALEPEFAPELRAHDLARLGRHEIALKLAVAGVTSAPFTAVTDQSQ